jgi:hypothetical protein
VSFDHVGLWFEITPSGREQWAKLRERFSAPSLGDDPWKADYDAKQEVIVAKAPSEREALAAVKRLARVLQLEIDEASCRALRRDDLDPHAPRLGIVEVRCNTRAKVLPPERD